MPGICGPIDLPNITCKISHSSSYPNKIGVYPSEFLPSTFTIWHAVFASQFPQQTLSQEAQNVIGTPLGAGLLTGLGLGGAFSLTGPLVHTFQSHHFVIFAQTANRVNVSYVLTEDDIANIDDLGIAEIDVGEYVFEV